MTLRIGLVGFGKIARDEHLPAIQGEARCQLAAIATRSGDPGIGVPCFGELDEMIAQMAGELDAIALCTPPQVRFTMAAAAIAAGLGVLLEKPPGTTLGEVDELRRMASAAGVSLYAAWHSQHAPGVAPAAAALAGEEIAALDIVWREDVRKWHPGQSWIWQAGGFGVFDPGINALSIATQILPCRLLVREARLLVPANRQAPIAADIAFVGTALRANFDWRQVGDEQWSIITRTASGKVMELHDGGHRLIIDGTATDLPHRGEYASIYARFADICAQRGIELDAEPLRICADAFLCGHRETVESFVD